MSVSPELGGISPTLWATGWGEEDPVLKAVGKTWSETLSIDQLVRAAQVKIPGYHATFIRLPMEAGGEISMSGRVNGQGVLRSEYGSEISFDATTGELKSATPIGQATLSTQILDAFSPMHYGTFGGLPVKILWCLGGLTPGILAVSGALM